MGSNWIEVGSAIMQQEYISAVSEIHFNKYEDEWHFHISMTHDKRHMEGLSITNKDESYVRKEHIALKNTLRNS